MPTLALRCASVPERTSLLAAGEGWPLDALRFRIGKEEIGPARILKGTIWNGVLVPHSDGTFLVELSTRGQRPGRRALRAELHSGALAVETPFRIVAVPDPGPKVPRQRYSKPELRGEAFALRRIGKSGHWHGGQYDAYSRDRRPFHNKGDFVTPLSGPVPGGCNWVPLGPAPFVHGKGNLFADHSGRIRSIAIDPVTPTRMYVGTASGGVWKSTDGGNAWSPKTDDKFSLAIGALAVDPVQTNIVYAGTGEYVPGTVYGGYYGHGLLKSTNFGETWIEIATTQFDLAEIARIVIDPVNPTRLYVAASNGLWEGTGGGGSWTQLSTDPCTDVILVRDPAAPGVDRLFAGLQDGGLATASRSGSGPWSTFAAVSSPAFPTGTSKRIVLGVCRDQPQHIYAAFTNSAGSVLAAIARSATFGSSWIACNLPAGGSNWQANYNLSILPHPSTASTVIFTMVQTWKSTDSGGTWTQINLGSGTTVHVDDHAVAYHPTTPDAFFVATDGGLFYSPDLGASWQARNLDLATLQLYDIGQHPQYESIMIAGAQDNGGFHYSGAPIWKRHWATNLTHNEMQGDVVAAQIDPFNGYVHYYGTGPDSKMRRSDDGGRLFPTFWSLPGALWWFTFCTDPANAGVVYWGGTKLHRSEDRGASWADVTSPLPGLVRAIAFRPGQPLVVYVATTSGVVYRLNGPATGAWTSTNVVLENITFTGLPGGQEISSLAVDAAGTVWAAISSLMLTEAPGEFTTDHVYRLDAGAMSWTSRSAGLATANPVNTIVIDPLDSNRVFCGADRGAFLWDAAANSWTAWDQGLPNAPVVKLLIHAPSRKIRAATYGRGVWERSVDDLPCADYFLYLRDNLTDSGVTPSPDGVPHPYLAGEVCWHWQSEDIVVDPSPFQSPSLVDSPTELARRVVHLGGRRGANRVYVTVHNKGPFAVANVRVRAFFAPASAGLPPFPPGLVASPFAWSPSGVSDWNPVGPSFGIASVEPGTTRLARWEFVIPTSAPRHSCLLAFVTSDEDPFDAGGISNPDQLVLHNRKVTLKNLDLEAVSASGGGGGAGSSGTPAPPGFTQMVEVRMYAPQGQKGYYGVAVRGRLPRDAVVAVALHRDDARAFQRSRLPISSLARRIARRLQSFGKFDEEAEQFDLRAPIVFDASKPELKALGEILISTSKPVRLALWVYTRTWRRRTYQTIDVVQLQGAVTLGGYTLTLVDPETQLPAVPRA